jgi:multiple sugar transport system ATP-binding protein
LRPEFLRVVAQGRLSGRVVHYERLGTDTHVIVDIGEGKHLTVRLVGQSEFALDAPISLDFDDDKAVLFDAQGDRITTP